MSKFKIGDKVKIRKDSKYYKELSMFNPRDVEGEVSITYGSGSAFEYNVKWPEASNSYRECDLELSPSVQEVSEEHTGGSSSYYVVAITKPTTPDNPPYVAECNDIIEALGMTFAEGNNFKATWRTAAARQGKKKKGNNAVYDAEKCFFFSNRMLVKAKEDV